MQLKSNIQKISILLFVCLFSIKLFAVGKKSISAQTTNHNLGLSYDLSASSGNYNGLSYTEITLGLNWEISDWLIWRNAIFNRSGSKSTTVTIDPVYGLDSSLRFSTSFHSEAGGLGFEAFAGPGVRLASQKASAMFGEAGFILHLGGLSVGAGLKSLQYFQTESDSSGVSLPKSDTQTFIVISGSGKL